MSDDNEAVDAGCARAVQDPSFRAWLERQVRAVVLDIDVQRPPEMVVYRGFHQEGRRDLVTEILRRAARHEGRG